MKKNIFFIARILIGAGIIFVLLKIVPYQDLLKIYKDSQKIYVILAFFILFLTAFLGVARWRLFLSSLGLRMSFKEVAYSSFSSYFLTLFLPSLIGSDAFRVTCMTHRHKNMAKAVSSIFMDRFSGAFSLCVISLGVFLLARGVVFDKDVLIAMLLFLLVCIFVILVIFNKTSQKIINKVFKEGTVKEKINHLYKELHFFRYNKKIFFRSLIYSVIIHLINCFVFYFLAIGFGCKINIVYFLVIVPIITFISLIPVTIVGLGTREAATLYFFSRFGMSESVAFAVSLSVFFFYVVMSLLGGLVYVMVYHRWLESHI